MAEVITRHVLGTARTLEYFIPEKDGWYRISAIVDFEECQVCSEGLRSRIKLVGESGYKNIWDAITRDKSQRVTFTPKPKVERNLINSDSIKEQIKFDRLMSGVK